MTRIKVNKLMMFLAKIQDADMLANAVAPLGIIAHHQRLECVKRTNLLRVVGEATSHLISVSPDQSCVVTCPLRKSRNTLFKLFKRIGSTINIHKWIDVIRIESRRDNLSIPSLSRLTGQFCHQL